jgi:hypothetical protein
MEVEINVCRFMGAFYSFRERREQGIGEKRRAARRGRTALPG